LWKWRQYKGKAKVHPITGHKGPEGEQRQYIPLQFCSELTKVYGVTVQTIIA